MSNSSDPETATRAAEQGGLPFGPQGDVPVQGQGSGWIYDAENQAYTIDSEPNVRPPSDCSYASITCTCGSAGWHCDPPDISPFTVDPDLGLLEADIRV